MDSPDPVVAHVALLKINSSQTKAKGMNMENKLRGRGTHKSEKEIGEDVDIISIHYEKLNE